MQWSQNKYEKSWSLRALAGSLVELSSPGSGSAMTYACKLILEAQQSMEPTAWIIGTHYHVYPPDLAASGIDLDNLVFIRMSNIQNASRSAEILLQSGAFGLVVIDAQTLHRLREAVLMRLSRLTARHHSILLLLTEKPRHSPSLGTFVCVHGHAAEYVRTEKAVFSSECTIQKDKRRGPGWNIQATSHATDGLH